MYWSHEQRAQKAFQKKFHVVDVFQKRMSVGMVLGSREVNFFDHGNNVDDGHTQVLAVEVGSLLHGVGFVLDWSVVVSLFRCSVIFRYVYFFSGSCARTKMSARKPKSSATLAVMDRRA